MNKSKENHAIYSFEKEKRPELKELYNQFINEYSIELNKGAILVTERFLKDGIEISPEKYKEEITNIIPLKPESELEIKLITKNVNFGFSLFKTKDNKTILIDYKRI